MRKTHIFNRIRLSYTSPLYLSISLSLPLSLLHTDINALSLQGGLVPHRQHSVPFSNAEAGFSPFQLLSL